MKQVGVVIARRRIAGDRDGLMRHIDRDVASFAAAVVRLPEAAGCGIRSRCVGARAFVSAIASAPRANPFVLGTSSFRGSRLTACRSALAVALKIASAMWWLLVP